MKSLLSSTTACSLLLLGCSTVGGRVSSSSPNHHHPLPPPRRRLRRTTAITTTTTTTNQHPDDNKPQKQQHHHLPQLQRRQLQTTLQPTVFGEDLNPSQPRAPLTDFPNATAARNEFFTLFDNVETENFESFPSNTKFPFVSTAFATVGNATLSGSTQASVQSTGSNDQLRYATSGTQYLDMNANDDFFLTLEQPIVGFGFFATDIGDVDGTLAVETTSLQQQEEGNAVIKRYLVPHTVGRGSMGADGAVIYVGILDLEGFDQVRFDLDQQGDRNDNFGFDDFSVFALEQTVATQAPTSAPTNAPTTTTVPVVTTAPTLLPTSVPTLQPTTASPATTTAPTKCPDKLRRRRRWRRRHHHHHRRPHHYKQRQRRKRRRRQRIFQMTTSTANDDERPQASNHNIFNRHGDTDNTNVQDPAEDTQ